MPAHTPTHLRSARRGFSLIEMLTVVSIAGLLLAITFPAVKAIQGDSKINAVQNTIGMSIDVARQWVKPAGWSPDAGTPVPAFQSYSGTAALVCPTGEIRIVVNDRIAQDPAGSYLEDQTAFDRNGYRDLTDVDYIKLPNGGAIAGIQRSGGTTRFLAPPFALAFNEFGQMSFGDTGGLIYYDADGNFRYDTSAGRGGTYKPSEWDGEPSSTNANVISNLRPVKALPFEAIECVAGVMIYNPDDFKTAGFSFDDFGGSVGLTMAAGQWLQNNGKAVFFSPQTGTSLLDEGLSP